MSTVILDNIFGRQFNSLNDASINPRNGEIYFTDPTYGYNQDFRPPPGMPKQVWRFNEATGAVRVAADGFNMPNGKHRDNHARHFLTRDFLSHRVISQVSPSPQAAPTFTSPTRGQPKPFSGPTSPSPQPCKPNPRPFTPPSGGVSN